MGRGARAARHSSQPVGPKREEIRYPMKKYGGTPGCRAKPGERIPSPPQIFQIASFSPLRTVLLRPMLFQSRTWRMLTEYLFAIRCRVSPDRTV